MNVLAHLVLSGQNSHWLVGNYLGDFLTRNAAMQLPVEVQKGWNLHHEIDQYTDGHEVVAMAKQLLKPTVGRYAGVAVDIIFDYYLANQFEALHRQNLHQFHLKAHGALHGGQGYFNAKANRFYGYLSNTQMLMRYGDKAALKEVFYGMSRRASEGSGLQHAVQALEHHHSELQLLFETFYPQLCSMVATKNPHFTL